MFAIARRVSVYRPKTLLATPAANRPSGHSAHAERQSRRSSLPTVVPRMTSKSTDNLLSWSQPWLGPWLRDWLQWRESTVQCLSLPPASAKQISAQPDPQETVLHDPMQPFHAQWAEDRKSVINVDPVKRHHPPTESDSTLALPWKTVNVPPSLLRRLCKLDDEDGTTQTSFWDIGNMRPAGKSNPLDTNDWALGKIRQTRRPGNGRFTNVATGPYGERYSKYLYVIDDRGMHIVREMSKCDVSSRGVPLHSLVCTRGVVGGEMFFDTNDPGKVFINFGSARYPVASAEQAVKVAEFVLSVGYHTVVAMIPQRDFRQGDYGLGDRYGNEVQNVVFRIGDEQGRYPALCVV